MCGKKGGGKDAAGEWGASVHRGGGGLDAAIKSVCA